VAAGVVVVGVSGGETAGSRYAAQVVGRAARWLRRQVGSAREERLSSRLYAVIRETKRRFKRQDYAKVVDMVVRAKRRAGV